MGRKQEIKTNPDGSLNVSTVDTIKELEKLDITKVIESSQNLIGIQGKLDSLSQAHGGVPCKNLGMIPNDQSKALDNYALMIDAIKQGSKILVDDAYYVRSPYKTAESGNEVLKQLTIVGNNKVKSKLISLGGHFFNAKGNILVENISLECISTKDITYFVSMLAPYKLSIDLKNNYISGNVRVVDSNIPLNYDFSKDDSRITQINIEDNDFVDVYNNSGSRAIFRLTDTPVTLSYIRDNKVRNFSYVFYNNAITNANTSADYIYNSCKKTYVHGNTVVNDDTYNALEKNGGFKPAYFCFCLMETYSCECRNNTFEGFNISDAPDTVVYDNYFSVTELIYENNTWKNIVNFTPNIQYVDIMKSKMGGNGSSGQLLRIYRKNSYIVEKSYAEKFQKDPFLLRKQIDTYQEWIDKVIIEDNYFDLYTLSFNRFKYAKDYIFNKNTIKVFTVENSVNTQAFIGIVDYKNGNDESISRQMVFSNNTVIAENPPIGGASGTLESSLIRNYSGNADKVNVIFENNYIKTYELKYILSDERNDVVSTNNPCLANVKFNGNTIVTEKDTDTYLMNKKFSRLFSFKNNEIESSIKTAGKSFYLFQEQSAITEGTKHTLPLCIDLELDLKYKADQWLRLLPLKGLLDDVYKVSVSVKILSALTFEEFDFDFSVENNGMHNIIKCMGLDKRLNETQYMQKTYVLDGSGMNYNNFYIQRSNEKGTKTCNVNVSNSATSKEIMLSGFSPRLTFNDDKVKIKITITK